MKQVTMSKRDIKDLNKRINQDYGVPELFSKTEFMAFADGKYYVKEGDVVFFYSEDGDLVPSIRQLLKENFLKKIIVDMGAVPFMAKGADVLRPGVISVDEGVTEGMIVSVVDEKNQKPLAVVKSSFSKQDIDSMDKGKIAKMVHHVGDDVWNLNL